MKIKTLTHLKGVIITAEGKKKINDKGEIEVSTNLARQMVDGTNWELSAGEKFPKQKKIEEPVEDFEDEEEFDEETDDIDEDEEEEDDDSGDEQTAALLKTVPKMKFKEAVSTAEDLGIDVSSYDKKNFAKLKAKIIKVLKGKESAED